MSKRPARANVLLSPDRASALLLGAGGAGAATMAMLLISDTQGMAGGAAARLGALGFAFVLSVPLLLAATSLLRPPSPATPQVKGLLTLGTMLWLAGVGADLFIVGANASLVTAFHAAALTGGVAYALAGIASKPLNRAARRRVEERDS